MELALSLGDTSKPFPFLDHHHHHTSTSPNTNKDLGFCMGSNNLNPLILGGGGRRSSHDHQLERKGSSDPPLQLDLLPFSPLQRHQQPPPPPPQSQPRFPWLAQNLISESGKRLEMNRQQLSATTTTVVEEGEDGAALSSSPNSALSSYNNHQMDFTSMFRKRKRDFLEAGTTRGINSNNNNINNSSNELLFLENGERSGGDEEDINGLDRKKLRLTKDQSAFLEESFKEHTTLNPKQKLALAKQLNLRPRQVEVWFQNRRARTKLKQTEVDCEYLKRCCETLTEENRRLQKEVQELRALKSSKPFYMQLPATTLTMCPSCERVASTTTAAATNAATTVNSTATVSAATTNTTLSLASSRSKS